MEKGILSEVSTVTKGETSSSPPLYPSHYCVISECKMKPSQNLQYGVTDLRFNNIVVFLIKNQALYQSDDDINNIKEISKIHCEMVNDILRLRGIVFFLSETPEIRLHRSDKNLAGESQSGYSLQHPLRPKYRHGSPIFKGQVHWRIQGCK